MPSPAEENVLSADARVAIVVIGRNEGERLEACLDALGDRRDRTLYVDSGSTDGSVEAARVRGVRTHELDPSRPFSAARARNEGLAVVRRDGEDVDFVQFVDGDCVLAPGWLHAAVEAMDATSELAAVCGRLRERDPSSSIYNRLAALEWNGPVGDVAACGGVAMMRAAAFEAVGGFDEELREGEEPELCLRLRSGGWRVRRLPIAMAEHDARMTRFGAWWQRTVRGGRAFAAGHWKHRGSPARYRVRELRRILFWAVAWPSALLVAGAFVGPWASAGLGLYALPCARATSSARRRGESVADALLYGGAVVAAKFPEALGVMSFHLGRGRAPRQRAAEAGANAR